MEPVHFVETQSGEEEELFGNLLPISALPTLSPVRTLAELAPPLMHMHQANALDIVQYQMGHALDKYNLDLFQEFAEVKKMQEAQVQPMQQARAPKQDAPTRRRTKRKRCNETSTTTRVTRQSTQAALPQPERAPTEEDAQQASVDRIDMPLPDTTEVRYESQGPAEEDDDQQVIVLVQSPPNCNLEEVFDAAVRDLGPWEPDDDGFMWGEHDC